MKLLVVEDEKIILNGIIKHICWEELGIDELRSARNAAEALEIFSKFSPDVVLSDINMPGKDGISMCREMKSTDPDLQVVLITGFSQMEYLKGALDVGVSSYIEKPLDMEELKKAIGKAVHDAGRFKKAAQLQQEKKEPVEKKEEARDEEQGNTIIQTVKGFIRENYNRPDLKIGDAAKKVYLTPTYLSSLFKSKTGMTVGQYITRCRVEKAKELLLDPRYKLYDIAEMVGYNDENYFARTFRKWTGMTPSEYKENPEK